MKPKMGNLGFTLIEIMIVVLIIGILLAVAVPNFTTARENSRARACIANLKQIQGAKDQWAIANKKGSTDSCDWSDLVGTDKYMKLTPTCPSGGSYTLGTIGEDPTCNVYGHVIQ